MSASFHPWGPADPKPTPKQLTMKSRRLDGGDRLAELSRAWQSFGCAVCGQVARPGADSGWSIELHHTTNRSQGGHDSPLLGLCGELLPNKCHWRVTVNRLRLEESAAGWVWIDQQSGETGLCRVLDLELAAETGLERALTRPDSEVKDRVWKRRPVPLERAENIAREEGIDVSEIVSGGVAGAEARFNVARELNHRAQRAWMSLAIVIQKAMQMNDPSLLGFATQEEWADAIGIDTATFSKLKLIGMQFAGAWEPLSEADKRNLSLEGLYIAARMMKLGHWSESQALSEAVAQPVHKLYRSYRETLETGEKPHTVESHACPECGRWHSVQKSEGPPLE